MSGNGNVSADDLAISKVVAERDEADLGERLELDDLIRASDLDPDEFDDEVSDTTAECDSTEPT